jgi:hypothetical protein
MLILTRYFTSRPEIFSAKEEGGASHTPATNTNPFRKEVTGAQAQAAAAAVGRAGNTAAKFMSTGFKNMQNAAANAKSGSTNASSPSPVCRWFLIRLLDVDAHFSFCDRFPFRNVCVVGTV